MRSRWVFLLVVLAFGASSSHALAGEVKIQGDSIRYLASAGETNRLLFFRDGATTPNFYLRDQSATLTIGAGCTSYIDTSGITWAKCSLGGIGYLWFDLGDGNDELVPTSNGADYSMTVYGGAGNDTITSGRADDLLFGEDGDDVIQADSNLSFGEPGGQDIVGGGPGADRLDGGWGNDDLDGGPGDDDLVGGPGPRGAGASSYCPPETGCPDTDLISGGSETDVVRYTAIPGDGNSGANVSLDDVANDGNGDSDNVRSDVENIVGTGLGDTLIGDADVNVLDGGGGNDTLDGRGGSDVLNGGDGNDTLDGGLASDQLNGDSGNDTFKGGALTCPTGACFPSLTPADTMVGGAGSNTVDYSAYTVAVVVDLATGTGSAGGSQSDVFSGIDSVVGGSGNDTLWGNGLPNSLWGGPGNDTLTGQSGLDAYDAGAGNDTIDSQDGTAESPICGPDSDTLRRDPLDTAGSGCEAYSPRSTAKASITGTMIEGQTLTASGSWEAAPAPSQTYQWRRCNASGASCSDITDATGVSYVLAAADVGVRLRVLVSATNAHGSDSSESDPTAQIERAAPLNTAPPTISGTARRGSTLTASPGTWSTSEPQTFAYQWERCPPVGSCAPVPGATASTYGVVLADVDQTLRVVVTATNGGGSNLASSERTPVIMDVGTTTPPLAPVLPPGCTIAGTAGNDVLVGTARKDVICGLGGNDTIKGLGGNDTLKGAGGKDKLIGGAGADILLGGAGNDTLTGSGGKDVLKGQGGADLLLAKDRVKDTVNGGPGKDRAKVDRGLDKRLSVEKLL